MKRIIMLLVLLFILTGCSANVNITLTSSGIEEEISVSSYTDANTTKEQIYSSFRKYMPVYANVPLSDTEPDTKKNGIEYYDRKQQDLGAGYKFTYSYKYGFNNYKNAKSIKHGFDSYTIQRNNVDKNIMISTDSSGLNYFEQYPDLESVTINIRTSYKAIETNADYVNGNTYTWVLRKGTKKSIYLLVNDPNADKEYDTGSKEEEKKPNKVTVIEQEEKEKSEVVKYLNDNPFLIGTIAIIGFFVLVLVLAKISKLKVK